MGSLKNKLQGGWILTVVADIQVPMGKSVWEYPKIEDGQKSRNAIGSTHGNLTQGLKETENGLKELGILEILVKSLVKGWPHALPCRRLNVEDGGGAL